MYTVKWFHIELFDLIIIVDLRVMPMKGYFALSGTHHQMQFSVMSNLDPFGKEVSYLSAENAVSIF